MNPTRIENRHGGGIPDLELQWETGSAFVELKAPRSTPRTRLEKLKVRPYLFGFFENDWEQAMLKGLTCTELIKDAPDYEFDSCIQSASLASKDQKAWHARRYANGGLSFFLQSTPGQRSKVLLSPVILPETKGLVLCRVVAQPETKGLVLCRVVAHDSWSVVLYALRLCAEMHSLAALRLEA
jgi:hypothetical protein